MDAVSAAVVIPARRAHLVGGLAARAVPIVIAAPAALLLHSRLLGLLLLLSLPSLLVGILRVRSVLRQPWAVRIDADGIDWAGGSHVDWNAVAEIRLYRHRWWERGVRLFGQTPDDHLVLPTATQLAYARRARSVPTGPGLHTSTLAAGPDELLAAIRTFSSAPVHER